MNLARSAPETAGADRASKVSLIDFTREETIVIATLTATAFALGVITIARTIDIPGDGPTRAMGAYLWSGYPHLETYGVWLPAYQYTMALCLRFVPEPMRVPRVINLIVGALTIPVFYLLIR